MSWLLALGIVLRLAVGAQSADDWGPVWERLEALTNSEADGAAKRAGLEELAELARAQRDDPYGLLLAAQLDLVAGKPADSAARRLAEFPAAVFSGRAPWLLAEVVLPGRARVEAVLRGLETTPQPTREELLLAWNVGRDEARGMRLAEGALPIQEVLHARYQTVWSAIDLALTRTRLGDREGADTALAATIEREEGAGRPSADLWSQRGISALGFGDERRARDYFGQALARGSEDAALVLGWLELEAGRLEAARKAFRPSILSEQPAAWALRGWGLTLLPAPHAVRADRPGSPKNER